MEIFINSSNRGIVRTENKTLGNLINHSFRDGLNIDIALSDIEPPLETSKTRNNHGSTDYFEQ